MKAADIRAALKRVYGNGNAHAIAFEVAQGTGRHANRHIDAVVMSLWPSRGLTLHAMEIKVAVSDLKKEFKDGSKAEEIAQYCDMFSLVVPLGLLTPHLWAQVPAAWGVIEVKADGGLKYTRQSTGTKARKVDREFMAAMLRAMYRSDPADIEAKLTAERNTMYQKFTDEVETAVNRRSQDGKSWRDLLAALGVNRYEPAANIIAATKFVMASGVLGSYEGVGQLSAALKRAAETIDKATVNFPEVK